MMNTISKYLFIIITISTVALACQNNAKQNPQVDQSIDETTAGTCAENVFFKLDFREENTGIEEFREYFFTDFPHNDPTQGDVIYDQSRWSANDLIETGESGALKASTRFRKDSKVYDSYRLTTKSYYNLNEEVPEILFVFKGSLPSGPGIWPAWWLNGSKENEWIYQDSLPAFSDSALTRYSGVGEYYDTRSSVNNTDWPAAGEIDIIENINGEKFIHNTIHTCPGMCDSEWNDNGVIINCANAQPMDMNKGCSGETYDIESLSGTFACTWEKESISFYYWPDGVKADFVGGPLSQYANPALWQNALKNRVRLMESDTPCDMNLHQPWQCRNCEDSQTCEFVNMKMIFNATLCGVWAGNTFDDTGNALENCREYIFGEGIESIDGSFMQIEYVAVKGL